MYYFYYTGKGVLGDFIRKTDYLKAKKNYEDSADNPCNQLNDIQRKCNDTLEELKVYMYCYHDLLILVMTPATSSMIFKGNVTIH